MNGAKVVPGPGDPDGTGRVIVQLIPPRGDYRWAVTCVDLEYEGLAAPSRVEVHRGRRGEIGPVKLSVRVKPVAPGEPDVFACRGKQSPRVVNNIRRHERRFYAEAFNPEFPNGAIRGQLRETRDSGQPKPRATRIGTPRAAGLND